MVCCVLWEVEHAKGKERKSKVKGVITENRALVAHVMKTPCIFDDLIHRVCSYEVASTKASTL